MEVRDQNMKMLGFGLIILSGDKTILLHVRQSDKSVGYEDDTIIAALLKESCELDSNRMDSACEFNLSTTYFCLLNLWVQSKSLQTSINTKGFVLELMHRQSWAKEGSEVGMLFWNEPQPKMTTTHTKSFFNRGWLNNTIDVNLKHTYSLAFSVTFWS